MAARFSFARAGRESRPTPQRRIAHVLSSLEMGGQERVALDLATAQRAQGLEVFVYSLAPPPEGVLGAAFRRIGVAVETPGRNAGLDGGLPLRLALSLLRRRTTIVHTHNPRALLYGAAAARLAGIPVVHTKHGANPDRGRRLVARRMAAHLVDAFVAVSAGTAEVARALREVDAAKLHVVENGIDLARFHPDAAARASLRAALAIPESAWVVGTVGRLAVEKDQALLLRAAAPLIADGAHLVIAGAGPEAAALAALARALGVNGRAHFLGARDDVPRILAALDAFALPSRTEGLPLVVPEAMASALPVVATAVGGLPSVLAHGETGFLVRAGDEAALGHALSALCADPSMGEAIGARARELALLRFSSVRMATEYASLYERVLARAGASSWRSRLFRPILGRT